MLQRIKLHCLGFSGGEVGMGEKEYCSVRREWEVMYVGGVSTLGFSFCPKIKAHLTLKNSFPSDTHS